MRVLIVEDDPAVAAALGVALSSAAYEWTARTRGADALALHRHYDVILLDLGLPDMDGFEVLTRLRRISDSVVVVLSGRSAERDVVRALHLGADDYLVKPPRLRELLARLDVVGRRRRWDGASATGPDEVAACAGPDDVPAVDVDVAARTVKVAGRSVRLTPTEFAVLSVLHRTPGVAVPSERILDEVWGDAGSSTARALSVHVSQLRAKLGAPGVITTVRGHGYRLDVPPRSHAATAAVTGPS